MSGILGIWNFDGRPVEPSHVARLSGLIAHRGPDGEGRWLDGSIGFAFQNLWITPESLGESQPIVSPGQSVVLFDGRLDNREDLFGDLKDEQQISHAVSDAVLVSAAHRRFGPAFAEKLNGDFAVAVYDIPQQRLFLARDAIGVRPLYFAKAGDTFLVASEVKPILAHPAVTPRPNGDMLAAALLACFGEERQGWTFFDGVSCVLPGQLVTVTPGAITKQTYWSFGNPEPIRLSKFEVYAEAFREQFERAVARRLRSAFPVAIAVSGGVDSSSIYGTAETLRRRGASPCQDVLAVSMEVEGRLSDERLYLQDIERKYGTRIYRVPTKVRYATGSLRRSFRDLEAPYFRGGLDSSYPFQRAVRALGAKVVLTGQWGDQILADMTYLVDFIGRLRWITAWKHMAEYVKWFGGIRFGEVAIGLLKDFGRYHIPGPLWRSLRNGRRRLGSDRSWYTEEFWDRARQAEAAQQFRFPGRTAYQRSIYALVRPMYYQQWLERSNKLTTVNGLEEAFPFFDRDLISFMLAIPGGVACSGGIPKALLRAAMRGILPDAIAGRRWKAEVTQELADSMNRAFCSLSRYLAHDTLCVKFGFVDEPRLKTALPTLAPSDGSALDEKMWVLGEIFGLELWLQAFWGTKLDEEGG